MKELTERPAWLVEDIIRESVRKLIYEELCISNEVKGVTNRLYTALRKRFMEGAAGLDIVHIARFGDTFEYKYGDILSFQVKYQFLVYQNDEWKKYFKSQGYPELYEWKVDVVGNRCYKINIEDTIVGSRLPDEFLPSLQHEVAHVFDRIYKRVDDTLNPKWRDLYNKAVIVMQQKNNDKYIALVAQAVYYAMDNEIVAHLHELDAYLYQHKEEIDEDDILPLIKNSDTYYALRVLDNARFFLEKYGLHEDVAHDIFGVPNSKLLKVVKNGYKKLSAKIGKVAALNVQKRVKPRTVEYKSGLT